MRKDVIILGQTQPHAEYEWGSVLDMQFSKVRKDCLSTVSLFGREMSFVDLINYERNGRNFLDRDGSGVNGANGNMLSPTFNMNLSGIYLSDYLTKRGISTALIPNWFLDEKRLERMIAEYDPISVVISTTFAFFPIHARLLRKIGRLVKKCNPNIKVIVGGAGIRLAYYEKMLEQTFRIFQDAIDYVVIETHGEQTLVDMITAFKENKSVEGMHNVGFRMPDKTVTVNSLKPDVINMDQSCVAWDQVADKYVEAEDFENYTGAVSIYTSLGCPFSCQFCTFPILNNEAAQYKSIEAFRHELRSLKRISKVKHLILIDDNITIDPKRLRKVAEMMIEEDFGFTWSAYASSHAKLDDEEGFVRTLAESGCRKLSIGIESADPTVLKNMSKKIPLDHTRRRLELYRKYGIMTKCLFIIGYPGETEESVQKMIDFINNSAVDFYITTPYFHLVSTPAHLKSEEFGITGYGLSWKHNTMTSEEASGHLVEVFKQVKAPTDTQMFWGNLGLMLAKGYTIQDVKDLVTLKADMVRANLNGNFSSSHLDTFQQRLNRADSVRLGSEVKSAV
ncbi:MAG: radical SAM protein [Candidatus Lindowbacteria bacterium]|nr:radical SAM protein [Candidatus Lindowbacteria bacterium]